MDAHAALAAIDVPGREIVRCEVGSTLHGIGIGSDDLDLMGVTVEPAAAITGLGSFDQFAWRSAEEGQRSSPDDIDLVVYGLRTYVRLATSGNPTVILLLYADEADLPVLDDLGRELRELRSSLVSFDTRDRFLGYMRSQRRKLLEGSSGRGSSNDRGEKWASHMVRLGYQGLELASTGHLTLPMPDEQAAFCKAIKRGHVSTDEALTRADELEARLVAIDESPLPKAPDLPQIEAWLHSVYGRVHFL